MDVKTTWHEHLVSKIIRSEMKGQKPVLLWFTGLSGSGKSTLAGEVEYLLSQQQRHTYLLDGDNIRRGLCSDLAFDDKDRAENIRRIAEVSKLMLDAGIIVLAAFISPKQAHRKFVQDVVNENEFIEIFVDTSLNECEKRDVKGLYHQARTGSLKGFTGIDAEYQMPLTPDIHIQTQSGSIKEHAELIMSYLYHHGYINT